MRRLVLGHNVAPVRHGLWIGLRGEAVGQVPDDLWTALALHERQLVRLLRDTPSPFRRRTETYQEVVTMSEEPVLYRKLEKPRPGEFAAPLNAMDLADALFREVGPEDPENPQAPDALWYCENEDCPVREVRVECKQFYDVNRDVMRCPACRRGMRFYNWVETETWVRVRKPTPPANTKGP
jgi:hypothetical protein